MCSEKTNRRTISNYVRVGRTDLNVFQTRFQKTYAVYVVRGSPDQPIVLGKRLRASFHLCTPFTPPRATCRSKVGTQKTKEDRKNTILRKPRLWRQGFFSPRTPTTSFPCVLIKFKPTDRQTKHLTRVRLNLNVSPVPLDRYNAIVHESW